MLTNNDTKHHHSISFWLIAAGIVALGLTLRVLAVGVDGFWLDEIFGASYTNLSLPDVLISVARFDIHPPLYYLQLKLWSAASHSDAWLLANSIAWSLATVIFTGWGVSRIAGNTAGLASAAMIAVLGSEIYFASELRMYAMISCLTVVGWIRADIWSRNPSRSNAIWLALVVCILAGTHSIGFLPVSAVLAYALISCRMRSGIRNCLAQALAIVAAAAAVLIPCLINASFRSVSHTASPTLGSAIGTIAGWVTGYGALAIPHEVSLMLGILILALVALGLLNGDANVRLILACFVAWPILFLFCISITVRPLWIERAIAFCAPFFVIAMAMLLGQVLVAPHRKRRWLSTGIVGAAVAALAVTAVSQAFLPRKMQYREAAGFIARENTARLPIYIAQNTTFWGMARYLQGPEWGSLLEVQDPVRQDESETWQRIYSRLGPVWLERLHLLPKTRQVATPFGTMWIGLSSLPADVPKEGIWIVGNNNLLKESVLCGRAPQEGLWKFTGVVLVRCGRQGTLAKLN